MNKRIRRPRHATIVAYLALFAALGGGAIAATKIGTKQLQPNAVTSPKIAKAAVRAGDIKRPRLRVTHLSVPAGQPGVPVTAVARCKNHEVLLAGGGGWESSGTGDVPQIISSMAVEGSNGGSGPAGWVIDGAPGPGANTLDAQAICLPK
jgi:hypothetical protein